MEALMSFGIQGPKGDTGARGPQGATGPQGPAGTSGMSTAIVLRTISTSALPANQYNVKLFLGITLNLNSGWDHEWAVVPGDQTVYLNRYFQTNPMYPSIRISISSSGVLSFAHETGGGAYTTAVTQSGQFIIFK